VNDQALCPPSAVISVLSSSYLPQGRGRGGLKVLLLYSFYLFRKTEIKPSYFTDLTAETNYKWTFITDPLGRRREQEKGRWVSSLSIWDKPWGSISNLQVSFRSQVPDCAACTWAAARSLLSPLAASWRVGSRPENGPSKKGWSPGRHRPRRGRTGGLATISSPHGRRAERTTAPPWSLCSRRDPRPAGPGGSPRPRVLPSARLPACSREAIPPAPALPGALAHIYLDVLVLVFAFPAVPAGCAAAPHLPHRVFHGERVRVYGRERAALVPASA
jgi:hypothetical protein